MRSTFMVNIFPLGSTKVFDNGVEVVTPAPGMHRHVCPSDMSGLMASVCMTLLTAIRKPVDLAPIFRQLMDQCLNCNNSLKILMTFHLNNFDDKEFIPY